MAATLDGDFVVKVVSKRLMEVDLFDPLLTETSPDLLT